MFARLTFLVWTSLAVYAQLDTSPPAWSLATPRLVSWGESGATLGVALTEPGRAVYVLLPSGSPAPVLADLLSSTPSLALELARCVTPAARGRAR